MVDDRDDTENDDNTGEDGGGQFISEHDNVSGDGEKGCHCHNDLHCPVLRHVVPTSTTDNVP